MRHSRVNFKASRSTAILVGLLLSVALTPVTHSEEARFDPFEASILELQVAMSTGRLNAVELTHYYLERIAMFDQDGPALNAMAFLNPDSLKLAEASDEERARSGARGLLHGIPVVVKDNYETIGMPTTAGSALLAGFQPEHDAFLVARLKRAGAIILGKTNMHEFAYGITSEGSAFGAVKNPYDPARNPGGSSGGTGAAVAANFSAVGMGSDTCGSIRIPSAHNNLVGLRGTQGLSSRRGIIPLSHTQDIGGPLARSVTDLAIVLDATVGFDPGDEQTAASASQIPASYLEALTPSALIGKRIGVLEELLLVDPEDMEVVAVLGSATAELVGLGAEVVRVQMPDIDALLGTRLDGFFVLAHDFRTDINAYLAQHPGASVESLEDILASGRYHPVVDSPLRMSLATDTANEGDYQAELQHRQVIRQAILALMARQDLDALAYPTIRRKPAAIGEMQEGANCQLSANSGLPAISVPAGFTADGLPVGLELLARPWQEGLLLAMAYAYEQGAPHRRPPQLQRERSNESSGIRRR